VAAGSAVGMAEGQAAVQELLRGLEARVSELTAQEVAAMAEVRWVAEDNAMVGEEVAAMAEELKVGRKAEVSKVVAVKETVRAAT